VPGKNGEKKKGPGNKNGLRKNGEKKNGPGNKNGLTKNGEKKNRRGKKNPFEKKGLKKSCREDKETGDLGPKNSPLAVKRVAGRAASETPT
jgi:hypothetical protein